VLIGFEEGGEITAGAIHNPVTDEMYSAYRGGGAFLNGERIRVSAITELAKATFLHAGLGIVRKAGWWSGFEKLIDGTLSQRGPGDYLGYALVASGGGEIYAELGLKPWDLAPCKIVVEEAGGRFTDFEGRPTIYSGSALVTNGHLHDATLALLRRA
jgi:histidinol-phosphatase